jgi:hypothetical protein
VLTEHSATLINGGGGPCRSHVPTAGQSSRCLPTSHDSDPRIYTSQTCPCLPGGGGVVHRVKVAGGHQRVQPLEPIAKRLSFPHLGGKAFPGTDGCRQSTGLLDAAQH